MPSQQSRKHRLRVVGLVFILAFQIGCGINEYVPPVDRIPVIPPGRKSNMQENEKSTSDQLEQGGAVAPPKRR